MIVRFYNNSSDNADVHKNIEFLKELNCDIFEECSVQSPSIIAPMESYVINANYCYIPDWNRYYYITNSTIYNGDLVNLSLKVDVLMSFYGDFASSPVIAKRSTNKPNPHIPDAYSVYDEMPEFKRRKIAQSSFTPTASGGCYILTIGGK